MSHLLQPKHVFASTLHLLPGLGITFCLAASAMLLQRSIAIPGLSPLILAMVVGMLIRNLLGPLDRGQPGIRFSVRRLLRLAIVLLGLQVTIGQILAIGFGGLLALVGTLVATFVFTRWLGRVMGVDPKLGDLIAAGTAVCGASAVMACKGVTRSSDEDVAYAVACVTVFGSVAMIALPFLAGPMGLTVQEFGLWVGATVHEVAQVVAAAFSLGTEAGEAGTVAKLGRVMMLAPLILILSLAATRRGNEGGRADQVNPPAPWFAFGFLATMLANSVMPLPAELAGHVATTTSFLLTVALAAMGLETDIGKLRRRGLKPLVLGAAATLFITLTGLALILLLT